MEHLAARSSSIEAIRWSLEHSTHQCASIQILRACAPKLIDREWRWEFGWVWPAMATSLQSRSQIEKTHKIWFQSKLNEDHRARRCDEIGRTVVTLETKRTQSVANGQRQSTIATTEWNTWQKNGMTQPDGCIFFKWFGTLMNCQIAQLGCT